MSIIVDIHITNRNTGMLEGIDTLVIGRLDPLTPYADTYPYEAYLMNWPASRVQIEHRYSDGVYTLVEKALGALNGRVATEDQD